MSYFITLQSFNDTTEKSTHFCVSVVSQQNTYISSVIPISMLDEVMEEIDAVKREGVGFAIWSHESAGVITSFAPGTIERISIKFVV